MPIAAIPNYLGRNFKFASPGLRFGLYLPIWTERADQEKQVRDRANKKSPEAHNLKAVLQRGGMDGAIQFLRAKNPHLLPGLWEKDDQGAREAWNKVCVLNSADRGRMQALAARLKAMGERLNTQSLLRLETEAIAPFTTGLGNEHPLENGFAFLNPYGLPYLPGSGVKGVVRCAAQELASGEWGDSHGWRTEKLYSIGSSGRPEALADPADTESLPLSMFDVLFGKETEAKEKEQFRGVLSFWDVIPGIKGDRLLVEIMTPHFSHYYQPKAAHGSQSPHDSGQPNPISFLTVPPRSEFTFHVTCDTARLAKVAPDLAENDRWKQLLEAAFEHAFQWLGFGAKTAVGYGAMNRKPASATPARRPPAPVERAPAVPGQPGTAEATSAGPASVTAQPQTETVWPEAVVKYDPGRQEITAVFEKRTARLPKDKNALFFQQLGEERAAALKKKKSLAGIPVRIEEEGNKFVLLGLAGEERS